MYLFLTCLVCWTAGGVYGYWVVERGQEQGYPYMPEYTRNEYRGGYQDEGYDYYPPPRPYAVPLPYQQPPAATELRGPFRTIPAGNLPYQQPPAAPGLSGPFRTIPAVPVLGLRFPNAQTVIIPLKAIYSFPPLVERLVQRIQTYYSVYNPPESLTMDRPLADKPTTPSTFPNTLGSSPSYSGSTTEKEEQEDDNLKPGAETDRPQEEGDATEAGSGVSTLAVFEVTPTTPQKEEEDAPTTAEDSRTETTTDSDNYISPETARPADLPDGYSYEVPARDLNYPDNTGIKSSDYEK